MSRVDHLLASPAVGAAGRWGSRHRLRVFAMHGIPDVAAFDRQLTRLLEWFCPVGSERVLEWYREGRPLPDRAAWFTFDDGDRSTIVDAASVLHRHGVAATAFVCPAFVAGLEMPWWEVVTSAIDDGRPVRVGGVERRDLGAITALKTVDDDERRRVVASLAVGDAAVPDPVTVEDLERWRDLGGDLGNHTWDHPCLDRCTPEEQRRQIDDGARWLDHHGLWDRRLFAYPNGDRTEVAEAHLVAERYELVCLFDHALAGRRSGALRVSRLRLDAGAPDERSAAVSSGWHSALMSLRDRATALRSRGSVARGAR